MAGCLINAGMAIGDLTSLTLSFSSLEGKKHDDVSTAIEISIGSGYGNDNNAGGSVPHIALWDKWGRRMGQYKGDANGHLNAGKAAYFVVNNKEATDGSQQPEYLMLSMEETDAICVAAIVATGDGAEWTWLGDTGATCGADWFESNTFVGDGVYTPKCTWIDKDHTNGIRASGLSLHMPDFAASGDAVKQYREFPDSLCKSYERMTFWPSIHADSTIPTFQPPLNYTEPGGADIDPLKVITRHTNAYPDDKKKAGKQHRIKKRESNNFKEGHLVISNNPLHSAKRVCEHPNALGPDFVSTLEGVYCDMTASEWWYLCSADLTTGCFDLETQTMRGNAPGHKVLEGRDAATGRVIPSKSYETSETWNPR